LRVVRRGDVWGTGLAAWQWAEVFALLLILLAVDLEPQWVADRTTRIAVGVVALALLLHIAVWMVAELRRRWY
jgi:hypothetical protein